LTVTAAWAFLARAGRMAVGGAGIIIPAGAERVARPPLNPRRPAQRTMDRSTSMVDERDSIECWAYRRASSGPLFLLLKTPERANMYSIWQPVTGGMEKGEGAEEACAREVLEETGLRLRRLERLAFSQVVTVENGARRIKKRLFTGEALCREVTLSDEHVDYRWCDGDTARGVLTFDTGREALQHVVEHLNRGRER
jgi:8-oxo-dGTP pyrophosphatase MutT (NUDIX family)